MGREKQKQNNKQTKKNKKQKWQKKNPFLLRTNKGVSGCCATLCNPAQAISEPPPKRAQKRRPGQNHSIAEKQPPMANSKNSMSTENHNWAPNENQQI